MTERGSSGCLEPLHDRLRPHYSLPRRVTLFPKHIECSSSIAIKGQTGKEPFFVDRKDIAGFSPPRAADIRGFAVQAFGGDDHMACSAALSLLPRDNVTVGELPKRAGDFFAAAGEDRSVRADRFNGDHLTVYETSRPVIHANEKLVATGNFDLAKSTHIEASRISLRIESMSTLESQESSDFHGFNAVATGLFQAL
jgi:hypothetical protein